MRQLFVSLRPEIRFLRVGFGPDGRTVDVTARCPHMRTVDRVDIDSGSRVAREVAVNGELVVSPDGRFLAKTIVPVGLGGDDVGPLADMRCWLELSEFGGEVLWRTCLGECSSSRLTLSGFSPDGTTLRVIGVPRFRPDEVLLRPFATETGDELRNDRLPSECEDSWTLSPCGRWQAWDTGWQMALCPYPGLGEERQELPAVRSFRMALFTFSPDGRVLAARLDDRVSLWNPTTKSILADWPHPAPVRAVAFAPDGAAAVTGADDGARLWDVATGRLRQALDWGGGAVAAVAVAPNGLTAAAVSERGTVTVWDLG